MAADAFMKRKLAIFGSVHKVEPECNVHVMNKKRTNYMNRSLLIFGALVGMAACTSEDKNTSLVGCWTRDDGKSIECWEQKGDTLEGHGLQVMHGDTSAFEDLKLYEREGVRVYATRVGQNAEYIEFTETEPWVFVNPEHDFPKRIEYTFGEKNDLLVRVGEGEAAFTWRFVKPE
ncbi:hypothetical protein GCM10011318_10240 [Phaeocystidibacter marisrubri]|nr:hypothetical protein GCM10011318_10240 [Phaeocystidibacter marisrubri]